MAKDLNAQMVEIPVSAQIVHIANQLGDEHMSDTILSHVQTNGNKIILSALEFDEIKRINAFLFEIIRGGNRTIKS